MKMAAAVMFGLLGAIIGGMGALASFATMNDPTGLIKENPYASITFPIYLLVVLVGARWFVEEQAKQSVNTNNVHRDF